MKQTLRLLALFVFAAFIATAMAQSDTPDASPPASSPAASTAPPATSPAASTAPPATSPAASTAPGSSPAASVAPGASPSNSPPAAGASQAPVVQTVGATLDPAGGKLVITQGNGAIVQTFTVQVTAFKEMSNNAVVTSVSNLAAQTFNVQPAAVGSYLGVAATVSTVYVQIPVGGANGTSTLEYSLQLSAFSASGKVKLGTSTYEVTPQSLGITFAIVSYPFTNYDNYLDMVVSITTPGASGSVSGDELFLYNGASWTFSNEAVTEYAPTFVSPASLSAVSTPTGVDATVRFYASGELTMDSIWAIDTDQSAASRPLSFLSYFF